jgi:eukaryotic-like serine/threonine-protein kinase
VTAASSAASLVVGRYALYGKIASGGMATVYFGRMMGAAGFTRTVAIKRLHPHLAEEPEFVSMMIDEARLAARVQHPNVAQTLDVVATGEELLIVMEYVAGESLSRLLRAEGARERLVPPAIVSAVMNGVLHGLHAAHEAKSDRGVPLGIVHRDVSPHNMLVGVDGLARVIDFGVAKAAGRLQTTREGVVKGKVAYMAPEQLSGQAATRLADVYAAGVVLWETLTGRHLFKADDDAGIFAQILSGSFPKPGRWVAGLPPALDEVVMRALERDPAARFATAREMADALVHAMPPALGADVGAWVEEVAKQVLDKRSDQLAEIESRSSVSVRPPAEARAGASGSPGPVSGSRHGSKTNDDDDQMPTIASQSSSIPVDTAARQLASALRASPAKWWLLAGAVAVALGIALVLARPGGREPSPLPVSSAATPAPASAAPFEPPPVAPATGVASASAPLADSSTSAGPATSGRTGAPKPTRPSPPLPAAHPARPASRPAGSVIYTTPD